MRWELTRFVWSQLRDIEIIIGARLESGDETMSEVEKEQLLQMQAILYSTEVCFLSKGPKRWAHLPVVLPFAGRVRSSGRRATRGGGDVLSCPYEQGFGFAHVHGFHPTPFFLPLRSHPTPLLSHLFPFVHTYTFLLLRRPVTYTDSVIRLSSCIIPARNPGTSAARRRFACERSRRVRLWQASTEGRHLGSKEVQQFVLGLVNSALTPLGPQ